MQTVALSLKNGRKTMDEYISRKAAIEDLSAEALERNLDSVMTDDAHRYHRAAQRVIAGVPAANVRPVVLCKDCKNRFNIDVCKCRGDDWFCGYGERKRKES